ncbi:hypothetical protein [Erythrobacter crassostreae]|uniref:Uncharacterized protein n=1 Tax=Erythrobacter crassostreae TaxID=2828328 RepID=A0A9X1F4E4_9SPHN|nr:hypothetical protein [Erythrobacter crassostrea]MBV7259761.1 hypothetical protein [Erythrobacter crassostrea]
MSNKPNTSLAQNKATGRIRVPLLIAALVVGILALAYIDGGEEPIRPIVQTVTLPGAAAESE